FFIIVMFVLLFGLSRAKTTRTELVIPAAAKLTHIEIQLEPRDSYPRFRTKLRTHSGVNVLIVSNLARSQTTAGFGVSFDVPAAALGAGEYELGLKGITARQAQEDIGYYYFRMQKP